MPRRETDDWLRRFEEQLQRMSGELAPASPKVARQKGWSPSVDVLEGEDHVLVKVELAGVRADQIQLNYNPDRHSLTVKGERRESTPGHAIPHQLEIEYGEFMREVTLPDTAVNLEASRAQCRNGMLFIVIPKVDAAQESVVVRATITVHKM